MVDTTNLPQINSLYSELNQAEQAIKLFNEGGRIIALSVGKRDAEDKFWQFTATASTEYMAYPPQMIDTIKGFLGQRLADLKQQLTDLGMTLAA